VDSFLRRQTRHRQSRDGTVIGEVADATVHDVQKAVRAATEAQASWTLTPARARSEFCTAYQLMVERTEARAQVMTLEMGKLLVGGLEDSPA
jgi:acyl-CoA reductase-like NAD-dependent aldehyde dehydrogenase